MPKIRKKSLAPIGRNGDKIVVITNYIKNKIVGRAGNYKQQNDL